MRLSPKLDRPDNHKNLLFANFPFKMLRNVLTTVVRSKLNYLPCAAINTTAIDNAARKGTREKARKKKVKVEVKKLEFVPHNQREYNK